MDLSIVRQFPISLQVVVLWCIALLNSAIFWSIGSLICYAFWGINPFNDPNALMDISDMNVVYSTRVMMVFQNFGMFLVPALIFVDITKYGNRFLGLNNSSVIFFVLGFLIVVVGLPLVDKIIALNESIVLPEWLGRSIIDEMESDATETTKSILGTPSIQGLWLNLLILAIVPALSEEMFFRGALLRLLKNSSLGWHGAIWVSALLFSIIHLQFYGFFPRLLLGALFGYMAYWSGSIWVPILAHFAHNAIYLLLWTFYQSEEPSTPAVIWLLLSILLTAFLIGAFYLRAKRPRVVRRN